MLRRSCAAALAGTFAGAALTHWIVSSLAIDVPGRGWYYDSCTSLVNAAIAQSGLNVEVAADLVSFLARVIAPAIAVLVFLGITGSLTRGRAIGTVALGFLYAAGAPLMDPAIQPEGLGPDQITIYEIGRSVLGGLFLMWIMTPRTAQEAPVVEAENKAVACAAG